MDGTTKTIDLLHIYGEILKSKREFMQSEEMMALIHKNNALKTLTQIQQNSLDTMLKQEIKKHETLMQEMEKDVLLMQEIGKDIPLTREIEKTHSNLYDYFFPKAKGTKE